MYKIKMIKQKILGALAVAAGIAVAAMIHDGTASLFLVPAGLYMIFTKQDCLW